MYSTFIKSNYNKHLVSNKHLLNIQIPTLRNADSMNDTKSKSKVSPSKSKVSPSKSKVSPDENQENMFPCKYCGKQYKHKQSVTKHIKYSCTKNKTEDLTELVRLMNLQIETQKKEYQSLLQSQNKHIEHQNKQIESHTKQIEKLMGKLDVNGTFNTTINHIQLLNYKDTDLSHLTDSDYKKCIKKVCFCVMNLIERVHYNPEKPENMNIYISNMKDKYLMVYEDGRWLLKNKKEINRLYEDKELMLEQWIEENKDPEMDNFFSRYLDLKKDNNTMLLIQDELKLMMFNQKEKLPMIEMES
jgi:hypothetical protein